MDELFRILMGQEPQRVELHRSDHQQRVDLNTARDAGRTVNVGHSFCTLYVALDRSAEGLRNGTVFVDRLFVVTAPGPSEAAVTAVPIRPTRQSKKEDSIHAT